MKHSFFFTVTIPCSVFGELGHEVFASVCRQANSTFSFLRLSRDFDRHIVFRVDSPDIRSANAAMDRLVDFRLNLIRNGYCRRHWHFGCFVKTYKPF